jgi:two-component system chemotaxis response regulator CheB
MKVGAVEAELPLDKIPAEILRFAADPSFKPATAKR